MISLRSPKAPYFPVPAGPASHARAGASARKPHVPPVVVLALAAGLMWLAAQAAPAANRPLPARPAIIIAFVAAGTITAAAGIISFRRAKTTVNPLRPEAATALVVSGIYQLTRNPMYLGGLFILLGWAAFLANLLAVSVVPAFVLYLDQFQIVPEERALASQFGPAFAAYCANVHRWF